MKEHTFGGDLWALQAKDLPQTQTGLECIIQKVIKNKSRGALMATNL